MKLSAIFFQKIMLFNSIDFAIFLPITFIFYWFAAKSSLNLQNFIIVAASYIFYAWWDWRFLTLILFSTYVDYFVGIELSKSEKQSKRKTLLLISIFINLGLLGFFKYFNFFLENLITMFSVMGISINQRSLQIILPIGISFYTFQTLSYTIDVYNRRIKATKDFMAFSAFVCFFPQLVAGPIEKAANLLHQFQKERQFNYEKASDGMRQVLWGLFKKIVIADNCAEYADQIFNHSGNYTGLPLFLGAFLFSIQIYGDFSGYSDIAIGTARLFGIKLTRNFAFPYFSRDIAEFWRRWHISLSEWFREYLYIPSGGSQGSIIKNIRNILIVFMVSAFWHGAKWTFFIWGLLNVLYFMPLMLSGRNRKYLSIINPYEGFQSIKQYLLIILTFFQTVLAWIFFRAESVSHAFTYIQNMFINIKSFFSIELYAQIIDKIVFVTIFFLIEWFGRKNQFALETLGLGWPKQLRYLMYFMILIIIFWFSTKKQAFIYFQF